MRLRRLPNEPLWSSCEDCIAAFRPETLSFTWHIGPPEYVIVENRWPDRVVVTEGLVKANTEMYSWPTDTGSLRLLDTPDGQIVQFRVANGRADYNVVGYCPLACVYHCELASAQYEEEEWHNETLDSHPRCIGSTLRPDQGPTT